VGETLPTLILVLGAIGLMSLLAQRIAIPAPVLLAAAGMVWSLAPSLPSPRIEPRLILSVFLPPLLYADAWTASWLDFRRWLRPILQLAIGLVAFTILAVGLVAHWLLPGLPWAACFLLGAIVSPTDTVAVHAVLERLRVPRRATAILGGESLVNDATGLLGAGLATVVVLTGVFEAGRIGLSFARIAGFGIVIGAAVGLAAATINYFVRGTHVLFAFSLVAPYAAFFLAEHAGASGVLAVVIAGFVASWRLHYIAPESRVELYSSWEQLVFLLNALMFLYIGLEAPGRLQQAIQEVPGIIGSALLISATVIAARFVWVFPGAYLPLWLSPRLRRREGGYPSPRAVILASWCGVRGAVSLAAALALPFALPSGEDFPYRDLILFVSFGVIFITLVGLGLGLPSVVRWLGVAKDGRDEHIREHESEIAARREALAAALASLDALTDDRELSDEVVKLLRARHEIRVNQLPDSLDPDKHDVSATGTALTRELISAERKFIHTLLRDGKITDESRRRIERDLDLEEASLANREYRTVPL